MDGDCWLNNNTATIPIAMRTTSICQRNCFIDKKERHVHPQTKPRGTNGLSKVILHSGYDEERYDQRKKQTTQHNGGPEQCALNAAACSKYTSRVGASQPAQTCALALKDHAQEEQDRDYNQRDIQIGNHLQEVSF